MVLWFKNREFMDWDEYKGYIDFMDTFMFQQGVRKQNIRNL